MLEHPRTIGSERLQQDVLTLRKRGLVPMAIADTLGVSDRTVYNHLRALGIEVPSYLTREGPERSVDFCEHCGRG